MAEGLTTALNLQKPPVNDLHGQHVQMVFTLKITYLQQNLQVYLHIPKVKWC
jgi:hypothetical protein